MYRSTDTRPSRPEEMKWRCGWVSIQHNTQIRRDESRAVLYHIHVQTAVWDVWKWQFVRRAGTHGDQTASLPPFLNPIDKILVIAESRIAEKKVHLSSEMLRYWQKRILLLCQRKSGLQAADVLKLWKKSAAYRAREKDSAMEGIIISADEDDDTLQWPRRWHTRSWSTLQGQRVVLEAIELALSTGHFVWIPVRTKIISIYGNNDIETNSLLSVSSTESPCCLVACVMFLLWLVMLESFCSAAVWRWLDTYSILLFPLLFPSRAAPYAM